jgi:transposase
LRYFGIDVHLEFCEIAVAEDGRVSQVGRIASTPEAIREFAAGLGSEDQVVLDASGSVMAIARILRESNVGRVVVSDAAQTRAISHARVKSDRFDAAMLARLLSSGMLSEVWVPDEATLALRRRVARRAALIRARTRIKNQVHGVVMRCLLGRPPVSDLFGKGRAWLLEQQLPEEEAETVQGCLRQIDFLNGEIAQLDQKIAEQALAWPGLGRLLTIPGVDIGTAAAVIAAVGDISRFSSAGQLVAYLGLDPKVRQSGSEAARYGHISKRGNAQARSMLVEAAWIAIRSPGPLRAFGERVRARRGAQVAAVAVARKLVVLCWQLLSKDEDYAFARPSLTRQKTRRLELTAGASRRPRRHDGPTVTPTAAQRAAERELQHQAELAYRRLVADWRAAAPKGGAGATPGRASSNRPSKGKAARQAQAPDACASLRQSPAPPQNHPTTKRSTRPHRSTRPPAPQRAPRHDKKLVQTRCTALRALCDRCALGTHPRASSSSLRNPEEKLAKPLTFHP